MHGKPSHCGPLSYRIPLVVSLFQANLVHSSCSPSLPNMKNPRLKETWSFLGSLRLQGGELHRDIPARSGVRVSWFWD